MDGRPGVLRRFFLPQYMLRPSQRMAEVYPAREFYTNYIRIAWPALMESVLVGLVSFVDNVMVSSCGEEAISAVGLTNQPRLLFYAIFLSFSIAVNAMVARRFGEGRQRDANRCLAMILPIAAVLCAALTVLAFAVSRPLLLFAGAKPDTIELSVPYFRIVMIGMNFSVFSLMINAAQRGCGNTRISMVTNLTANGVNIVFNALLIHGYLGFPRLGVTGAAIATAMGGMASAVISLRSVLHKDRFLRLTLSDFFHWDLPQLKTMLSIGSGSMVDQLFMRFGFFTYAKLVAYLGTMQFATHQSVMTIINLSFTVGDGLGIAAASLVGQNLGRRRPDHSLIYGKIGQRIGLSFSAVLICLFTFGGGWLMRLFSDETQIIETGRILLYIVACTSPLQISQVIFRGCLNGAGDTRYMAVVSFVSIAVVRPLLTYVFCYPLGLGVIGAWMSLFLDQLCRFSFAAIRFRGSRWYQRKI